MPEIELDLNYLMSAYQQGDQNAATALVRQLGPKLHLFLAGQMGSSNDALDKLWAPGKLWRKDLVTGKISPVAAQVFFRGYALGRNFVLFARLNAGKLILFSAAPDGGHATPVTTMPSSSVGGFSLNTKEEILYFGQLDSSGDEIMLVNKS